MFEGHLNSLPRYLVVDVFIVALLLYGWNALGRIHQATLVGTAVNVIPKLFHVPIVSSGLYVAHTHWLGKSSWLIIAPAGAARRETLGNCPL